MHTSSDIHKEGRNPVKWGKKKAKESLAKHHKTHDEPKLPAGANMDSIYQSL